MASRPDSFVGRRDERALIRFRVDAAAAGSGGLLLVCGPAGIGKSRLVEEALTGLEVPVRWGRCLDDAGAPPMWPWRRAAADLLDAAPEHAPSEAAAARFRMLVRAADALTAAAGPAGLVITLEDLHWADESSLRLLVHLAGELRRSHLLVLATYRPALRGDRLDAALPDLIRAPGCETITVPPLDSGEVAELVGIATGLELDADSAAATARRTGGNPLLVRAVARSLPTEPQAAARALRAGGGEVADLRHLLATVLGGLPAASLAVVTAAAVLGEEPEQPALAELAGGEAAMRAGLEDAAAAGLLAAGDGYRFRHALVRDGVLAGLDPAAGQQLNARAALALERTAGGDRAGEIASHWARAGDDDQLARWSLRAAEVATRALAFEQAAEQLATARDALERAGAGAGERAEVLVRLATAQFHAGRIQDSLGHCEQAAREAESAGREDLLAAAALVVQGLGHQEAINRLDRICDRALAAAERLPPGTRARLLAQRASLDAELERPHDAEEGSRQALEQAEGSGDPLALIDAVLARAACVVAPDQIAERLQLGRLAVRSGESENRPLIAVLGHGWCADGGYQVGNLPAVDDEIAAVQVLADRARLPLARWHLLRMRACRLVLSGEFGPAREASAEAYQLARRMQEASAAGMSMAFALMLGLLRRDAGELLPGWEQAIRAAPQIPLVRAALAAGLMLQGRTEESGSLYAEIRELPRTGLPGEGIRAVGLLVHLTRLVEGHADAEAAGWVHEQLRPWAHTCGGAGIAGVFPSGSMDAELGRMVAVAGRWPEAVEHYRDAVAANARIGARPFLATSRLGLAAALRHRAAAGDVEEAAGLARAAAAESRRLDLPGPLADADALMAALAADAREQDPLSEREHQVADLVAQALSNRQIASRLVLSERTVESHVRNILAKLGFGSRGEIIAWAHRTGSLR